jgi:flavin-dependent dehydrogenase
VRGETEHVDVAVIGGGPAGTAAALTLLAHTSRRVAVIERSAYTGWRVGEMLTPGVQPLLEYLGVWEPFLAGRHRPAHGTMAAWGGERPVSRDFLFAGRGHGWHLDRCRFDRMLASTVRERGGLLLTETTVDRPLRDAHGRWHLVLRRRGGPGALTASRVIEASGGHCRIGRRLGARQRIADRLMAVVGVVGVREDGAEGGHTLVETCPVGWWYSAHLPRDRMVVALMTDAALVRRHGLHRIAGWSDLLASSPHTSRRLAAAAAPRGLSVHPASSQVLDPVAGDGWVAAGDAAASFDPLSAMGVGYALSSGIHAARAVHADLGGDGGPLAEYSASLAAHHRDHLALRERYYRMERRWLDQPFWARRRGTAAGAEGGGRPPAPEDCSPPAASGAEPGSLRRAAPAPATSRAGRVPCRPG